MRLRSVCLARVLVLALLLAMSACTEQGGPPSPWQQPPTLDVDLRVTVEPSQVALLAPITVTLDRYRKKGVAVAFAPEVDEELFVTESQSTGEEREYGGGLWQRTTLVLLPVEGPGELQIPSFAATAAAQEEGAVAKVATTPEQTVTVSSLLDGQHGGAIEAPGSLFPTPFAGWWWVLGGTAAVALLALLIVWSRRRKPRFDPLTVQVPAHVSALRELQRWRSASRTTPAEIEAFYVGVSQVLRVYLEDRFGLHAPERTTEEFLRDLDTGSVLARSHRAELNRFLSQCDLVKFAKLVPTADDHLATFDLAEAFVESTREDRVQEPPASDSASVGSSAIAAASADQVMKGGA